MAWQSCGCILILHLRYLTMKQLALVQSFENLTTIPAPRLRRMSFVVKLRHASVASLRRLKLMQPMCHRHSRPLLPLRTQRQKARCRKGSIFKHISIILLVIIVIPSKRSGQLIHIQLNRCVIRLYSTSTGLHSIQGELEHRSPKARFNRTDKKQFVKQIAQIERRQARLRRIRSRLPVHVLKQRERVVKSPLEHHHIGRSQNNHEHIGTFLRKHTGDPAVQVYQFEISQPRPFLC